MATALNVIEDPGIAHPVDIGLAATCPTWGTSAASCSAHERRIYRCSRSEYRSRDEQRGEQARENANDEGDAEALYFFGSEPDEEERGDEGGGVGVEDGASSPCRTHFARPFEAKARDVVLRAVARKSARWRRPPCRRISTMPAMLGSVNVALNAAITPSTISRFMMTAKKATTSGQVVIADQEDRRRRPRR